MTTTNNKRGFAGMDPERLRAIARKGGQTSASSWAHRSWTSEEARDAGLKSAAIRRAKALARFQP